MNLLYLHTVAPESLVDPIVSPVSSNELEIEWHEPASPNGVITLYRIFLRYPNDSSENLVNDTSEGDYIVSGLSSFTSYGFFIQVCNVAGCSTSDTVYNTTLESGMYTDLCMDFPALS